MVSWRPRPTQKHYPLVILTWISSWPPTLAMIPSTILLTTLAVSYRLSFTPNWMSDGLKNKAFPPKAAIEDSLATLVLVDLFENKIAIVWFNNVCSNADLFELCFGTILWCFGSESDEALTDFFKFDAEERIEWICEGERSANVKSVGGFRMEVVDRLLFKIWWQGLEEIIV